MASPEKIFQVISESLQALPAREARN